MSLFSVRNMIGNLLCNFNSDLGIQTYIQYIGQKRNRNKYILGQSFCLATVKDIKQSKCQPICMFLKEAQQLN